MFQYRAVLVRLCQRDTDREIARALLMGRHKTTALRALASERCWLNPEAPLPEDAVIAQSLGAARHAHSAVSSLALPRDRFALIRAERLRRSHPWRAAPRARLQ